MNEIISSMDLSHADTRILIYRWLSTLFARELAPETLDEYRHGAGKIFLKNLLTIPGFESEIKTLQEIIGQELNTSDLAIELSSDFGYLFHGGGGQQSVPPCESVYTSSKQTTFQEAEQETRRLLEECGLGVSQNIREPADHIAIQLELIACLDEKSTKAESNGKESADLFLMRQKEFMEEHLLNWVPLFCKKCVEHDPGGFYSALVQLMTTLLKERYACLNNACPGKARSNNNH